VPFRLSGLSGVVDCLFIAALTAKLPLLTASKTSNSFGPIHRQSLKLTADFYVAERATSQY